MEKKNNRVLNRILDRIPDLRPGRKLPPEDKIGDRISNYHKVKRTGTTLLFVLGAALCLPAVSAHAAAADAADNIITQEYNSGLVLGTKIMPQEDGSWMVTLEAYLKNTGEETGQPYAEAVVLPVAGELILTAQAQLRDVITSDFRLKDPDDIRTYTARCTGVSDGMPVWAEPVPEAMSIEAFSYRLMQGNMDHTQQDYVKVSGFDYTGRAVSVQPHPGTEQDYGGKLIVEFSVVRGRTIGGRVPVNIGGVSGLYVSDGAEEPAGIFPVPMADVPIRYTIPASDRFLYTEDTASLSEVVSFAENSLPDGSSNKYVNIHYELSEAPAAAKIPETSFETGGSTGALTVGTLDIPAGTDAAMCDWVWNGTGQISEGGKYYIRCVITPSVPGSGDCLLLEEEVRIHLLPATFSLNPDEAQRQLQQSMMEARAANPAGTAGSPADRNPVFRESGEESAGSTDESAGVLQERVLPKTGDDRSMIPWILIAAAALLLAVPVLNGCVLEENGSK